MRAERILRKLLSPCLEFLHAAQLNVLVVVTEALFRSSRLSLTALGRALRSGAYPKHRIKRVDRFLGNAALRASRVDILKHLATVLLRGLARPVVIIDWTQIVDEQYALWAGMLFLGRTVPLYAEVHTLQRSMKRRTHERFLRQLRIVLPQNCHPILVLDAEFCTPFFEACRAYGFDFVVRLRGSALLRSVDGRANHARELAAGATARPRCAGKYMTYDANRGGSTLRIVVGAKPKRRTSRLRRTAQPNQGAYRKRALEAWVIATTLENFTAKQVVGIYGSRMQIEEMFRDVKDSRYGWAFNHVGTRDPERLNLLILVGSLAMLAALLAGAAAEQQGLTKRIQANTHRARRVLSLFRIGVLVINDQRIALSVSLVLRQRAVLYNAQVAIALLAPTRLSFQCCSKFRHQWHG